MKACFKNCLNTLEKLKTYHQTIQVWYTQYTLFRVKQRKNRTQFIVTNPLLFLSKKECRKDFIWDSHCFQ